MGPSVPMGLEDLWSWFQELSETRMFSEVGPQPISFTEIDAWSRLNRISLSPYEVEVIRRLDSAQLVAMIEQREKKAKSDG